MEKDETELDVIKRHLNLIMNSKSAFLDTHTKETYFNMQSQALYDELFELRDSKPVTPLQRPELYFLVDIFKELKFGRTFDDQRFLNECIDRLPPNKTETTWDYLPPKREPYDMNMYHDDWKQTLMTAINRQGATHFKYYNTLGKSRPTPLILDVPTKFVSLIESLEYYNKSCNMLSGRYKINFISDDRDYLDLDGFRINIANFCNL